MYEEFTRERLLVQERLEGLSASRWINGDRPDSLDPVALVSTGAEAIVHMVFVDGLFHADPHPGNVLLLDRGRVGLLDFGMVGRLSEARRREFVSLLHAVVQRDVERVVDSLLLWAEDGRVEDDDGLQADALAWLDHYTGVPLGELDVAGMLVDLTALVRDKRARAAGGRGDAAQGVRDPRGAGPCPRPRVRHGPPRRTCRPGARAADPRTPGPPSSETSVRRGRLMAGLPDDLNRLVSLARRGGLSVKFDLARLAAFGDQIERSANRITVGLITAALIVGTSIALSVEAGPTLFGLPLFGSFGFLSSTVVGVALLWSILRSGRRRD